MIKQLQAAPYLLTRGNTKYKDYVDQLFNHSLLDSYNEGIFDEWKHKDLMGWHRYTSDKVTIEFYPSHYIIKNVDLEYKLPIPRTLDEFIGDMHRLNVKIYWKNTIESLFEPRDFICVDETKDYYQLLLEKMNKSYELIL